MAQKNNTIKLESQRKKPEPRIVILDIAPFSLLKIESKLAKNNARNNASEIGMIPDFTEFPIKKRDKKYNGFANQIKVGINPPPKKLIHPSPNRNKELEYASESFLSIKNAGKKSDKINRRILMEINQN